MESVQVRSLDADGMETAVSDPATIAVKTPTLPSFELPTDSIVGEFILNGKADPGATVELMADGAVVGTAVADADGDWNIPIDLPAGDYALNARVLDAAGNLVVESAPMDVAIAPAFTMPEITLPTADADNPFPLSGTGQAGSAVDILVDGVVVGTAVIGDDPGLGRLITRWLPAHMKLACKRRMAAAMPSLLSHSCLRCQI